MRYKLLGISLLSLCAINYVQAAAPVSDEASLREAIARANADSSIRKIVFAQDAQIFLSSPVIYTGQQNLALLGNGTTIDGSAAGDFALDNDLTAITEDGTLVLNTAGDVFIKDMSVINSATRGVVINIPEDAQGDDIRVTLIRVNIKDSALYGLHIDDNADAFDEGTAGSDIGIKLKLLSSNFTGNGTGAIDFDGVRVDERGLGDIRAKIYRTHIDGNGGDGIELDEAGDGDVDVNMKHVTLNANGFYNESDLDDGFDIDEAGEGDIDATLYKVEAKDNMDEGLDFDEQGEGDVELRLHRVTASNNADEGIKVDEEDEGSIESRFSYVKVMDSGDDGIQYTELGDGHIDARLYKVEAVDNAKYGVKMEQWFEEDETEPVEMAGSLKTFKLMLSGNAKGDEPKVNNMIVK